METIRQPRSTEQATALLEQFAELDGQIAAIEANRRECIAAVNARCDTAANDLIARRDSIREKLAPWWKKNGEKLTEGKRKSIERGGCIIGSRAGSTSLAVDGTEDDVVAALGKLRWAKKVLLRVKTSLDRKAILKELDGKRKDELEKLGLRKDHGEETFILERVQQNGTLGGN